MRTKGRMTHCEASFLAGQKKATNGKAGLSTPVFRSDTTRSLLTVDVWAGIFLLLLGLLAADEVGMTVAALARMSQA